jgi:6-phosphofructokinase 1
VENAVAGLTDKMVGFERSYEDGKYVCRTKLFNLTDVANTEKKVPREWINAAGNGVEQPFIDYVLPLIQGEPNLPKQDSLPRFAKLKKVLVK